MAVTETTTVSWGSRLGSSLKGVLVGLGLFIAGFPVLFWNEGNTVTRARARAWWWSRTRRSTATSTGSSST